MANFKVFLRIIMMVCVWLSYCFIGKTQERADIVLNHLINIDNEKQVVSGCENCMFILITERLCEGCFRDMCHYAAVLDIDSIYAVDFMPKDLMKMLGRYSRFKESVICADDVFFLWTDKVEDGFITKVISQPSPQLIIVQNGKRTYLNYRKTIKTAK